MVVVGAQAREALVGIFATSMFWFRRRVFRGGNFDGGRERHGGIRRTDN